ncbi:MAG: aldo/keto reductase [Myxococcales bacterium]|nr:aldo/keto reductase [Myxococcales bacterium]MCB9709207.1 aldo/keto reductase [Myxococcales bacterium]
MLQQRRLGKTGIAVSELALGTWGMASGAYGEVAVGDFVRTVSAAIDAGMTTFDMAPLWGAGEAERIVGMVVAQRREKMCLITRSGRHATDHHVHADFAPAQLRRELEASLVRLGTDYLDVWLLHEPPEDVFEQEAFGELIEALKEEGKIRAWGASVSNFARARAALDANAEVLCLVHNLTEGRMLESVRADVERLEVGILARSPLAYGLLSGRWKMEHQFESHDHRQRRWDRDTLRARIQYVDSLTEYFHPSCASHTALALRFLLADPSTSSVLLGARSAPQITEAVGGIHEPPYLDEATLDRIKQGRGQALHASSGLGVAREDVL